MVDTKNAPSDRESSAIGLLAKMVCTRVGFRFLKKLLETGKLSMLLSEEDASVEFVSLDDNEDPTMRWKHTPPPLDPAEAAPWDEPEN